MNDTTLRYNLAGVALGHYMLAVCGLPFLDLERFGFGC